MPLIRLSPAVLMGLRTGLALVLAYGVSLSMDWDKPQWAVTAAMSVTLDSGSATLAKGGLRLLATVAAAVIAVTLIALFPQERWWFFAGLSLVVAFCGYHMLVSRYAYAWRVTAYVVAVIAVSGGSPDGSTDFATAIERLLENLTGISAVVFCSWLFSPGRGLPEFRSYLTGLGNQFSELFRESMADQPGGDSQGPRPPSTTPLRLEQELRAFEQVLQPAISASLDIRDQRRYWRVTAERLRETSTAIAAWKRARRIEDREAAALLEGATRQTIQALQRRFDQLAGFLVATAFHEPPPACPPLPAMDPAPSLLQQLGSTGRAELMVALSSLQRLLVLSEQLWQGPTLESAPGATAPGSTLQEAWVPDPDRLQVALRLALAVWLAALAWIFVPDIPDGPAVVSLTTVFAVVLALAGARVQVIVVPMLGALIAGGVIYVTILPRITGFAALASLIFALSFGFCVLFHRQPGLRTLSIDFMFISLGITNDQTFNILGFLNTSVAIALSFAILAFTQAVPWSLLPHRVARRLLHRYRFCSLDLLRLITAEPGSRPLLKRRRLAFCRQQLLALPSRLSVLLPKATPINLGLSPEQAEGLGDYLHESSQWLLALEGLRDQVIVSDLLQSAGTGVESQPSSPAGLTAHLEQLTLARIDCQPRSSDLQREQNALLCLLGVSRRLRLALQHLEPVLGFQETLHKERLQAVTSYASSSHTS